MQDLPLVTRDPYSLILLSPGAMQTNSRLGGFSVNGSSERNNNFMLDGLDNNDTSVPGGSGGPASLNPDATQEFRVITNNFMPEYGRNNGAIVDIVTKSGSNELHGDGYWFGRYNALWSAGLFQPQPGYEWECRAAEPLRPQSIWVFRGRPDHSRQTFFFVNSEWHRFRTTLTNATSCQPRPSSQACSTTMAMRSICRIQPRRTIPVDTLSTQPHRQFWRPVPEPNGPAVDDVRAQYFFPSRSAADEWNLTAKVDHRFSDTRIFPCATPTTLSKIRIRFTATSCPGWMPPLPTPKPVTSV